MNSAQGNLDMEIDAALQVGFEPIFAEQGNAINLAARDGGDHYPEFNFLDKLPSIDFTHAPTPDALIRDVLCSQRSTPESPSSSLKEPQIRIDREETKGTSELAASIDDETPFEGAFPQNEDSDINTHRTKGDISAEECSLLGVLAPLYQKDCKDVCGTADATADLSAIQPSEIRNLTGGSKEDMKASGFGLETPSRWCVPTGMHPRQQILYQRQLEVDATAPATRATGQPEGSVEQNFHNTNIPAGGLLEPCFNGPEAPLNLAVANSEMGVTNCDKAYPNASSEVNSSALKCSASPEKVIKKVRKDSKPKNRYSKGASSSHYCHVCGRKSRIEFGRCQNVNLGLCRKVICEKCLLLYEPQSLKTALSNNGNWTCTHCRNECPQVARCKQYAKNNQKRREKKARERAGRTIPNRQIACAKSVTTAEEWAGANPNAQYFLGAVKRTRSASSFATNPVSDATSTANNALMAGSSRHTPSADSECCHPRNLPRNSLDPSMIPIQPALLNSLMGGPHIMTSRVQNKAVGRSAQRREASSQALGCSQRPAAGFDKGT